MIHAAPPPNGPYANQHQNLPTLRGTQPGLLDPSQPSRLLRFPDSKLSFASFDPKTALAEEPTVQKHNNSGTLAPPKRIVIEISPKGASFWRFVPRARLKEGAQDEGIWPRVIDICGKKVHCYQEQWEIYKLDPKYHCAVYPWPKCSTVTWVELPNQEFETADPDSGKRSRSSSPESDSATQKKARSHLPDETDESDLDSDEDEVEKMVIDESFSQKLRFDRRPDATSREKIKRARLARWAKNRAAFGKRVPETTVPAESSFSMRVDSEGTLPSQNTPWPTEEGIKRKGNSIPESDNDSDRMSCDRSPRRHKRARTSPPKSRKGMSQTHTRHEKKRLNRLRGHRDFNPYDTKFTQFLRPAFVPPESVEEVDEGQAEAGTTETQSQDNHDLGETSMEAGSSREAEIAESIRKLQELEKDRPLWEEQRKRREACERAEEQERLGKAERRRREEEEQLRQQREAAERERRRAQEAERLALEEEVRQREIRQRRQRQRWESGSWTTQRALERYRMLSDEFDAAKFTSGQSITFHDIPWPVLHAPSRLTVEDVDWSAVEKFFATVKNHMRLQDYKVFVEKSHRRFHPDRWRARKIWAAVADEMERGYMEVAANTVAQAITPIWRAVKEQ